MRPLFPETAAHRSQTLWSTLCTTLTVLRGLLLFYLVLIQNFPVFLSPSPPQGMGKKLAWLVYAERLYLNNSHRIPLENKRKHQKAQTNKAQTCPAASALCCSATQHALETFPEEMRK